MKKKDTIEKKFTLEDLKILRRRAESHPGSIPYEAKEWVELIKQIVEENTN